MKKSAPWFLFALLFSVSAFAQNAQQQSAQNKDVLPANFLSTKHVRYGHPAAGGPFASQKLFKTASKPASNALSTTSTTSSFPPGVDSLVNFVGNFSEPGINFNGKPNTNWHYSIVGNPPTQSKTTVINAPVIPVNISMLNADGTPRYVITDTNNCPHCTPAQLGKRVRLFYSITPFIKKFLASPVFANADYSSSPVPTQFVDAVQKAEFGNFGRPGWHTLLQASLKKNRTMALIEGTYFFSLNNDGSCCRFVLVSDPVFGGELFPPSTPDNSTVIGSAEVAGDMTTKDITTLFFPNVYLYDNNNPNDCCVLGYHTFDVEAGDASNGNRTRFYVMNYSSWISPGLFGGGFQDITAHSHEVAEIFNDPFVAFDGIHNVTPFWQNPAGQCQDVMEVGDVIEDLPNPTTTVTVNGFTYHPQTQALLPWFEFKSPSFAVNGAYSYPNETVLTSLSAPQPFNCGQ
jgi:hypothetical protein